MSDKKIILDCDGVIADFVSGLLSKAKEHEMHDDFPTSPSDVKIWGISPRFYELFDKIKHDDDFWLGLPLLKNTVLNFKPYCYLTARPCSSEVTRQWINSVGLPDSLVLTVANPLDKIAVIVTMQPDVFVDDHIETVRVARDNGINAVLFNQPYQRGHIEECVGLPRIHSLGELK